MKKSKSCLGQKFGRLLILGQWVKNKETTYVLAQCDCGNLKEYRLYSLKRGDTRSCGCLCREVNTSHGMATIKVYNVWDHMVRRCKDPNYPSYKDYGGRGIKVCDRWLDIKNFYQDMGDRPKGLLLDRINNNKGYYKENCHWVTLIESNRNQRKSKYWYLFGNRYESSPEAAKALGVSSPTIQAWCDGKSCVQNGTRYEYPPKDGCHSELKYK